MTRKIAFPIVLSLCCALIAPAALAGGIIRGGDSGYDAIDGGAMDLTFVDATFLSRYSSLDSSSTHNLSFFGGPGFRIFLFRNFSLHLTPAFTYDLESAKSGGTTVKTSAWSLLPMLGIDYYIRLPGNFFFKPGISAGYYWGQKNTPIDANTTYSSTISGFAARAQLMIVYYAGPHMNLRAGLDLLLRFGSDDPDTGETLTATLINTGFTVGIGYTF